MTDPDNSQPEVYTLYEEMNTISEDRENRPTKILSTTTKVKAIESSKRRILNGLFDSEATRTHIKRSSSKHIQYKVKDVDINVKERYSSTKIKQKIEFQIQLPDFCSTKTVTAEALVDEEAVGVHDIVLGQDF